MRVVASVIFGKARGYCTAFKQTLNNGIFLIKGGGTTGKNLGAFLFGIAFLNYTSEVMYTGWALEYTISMII